MTIRAYLLALALLGLVAARGPAAPGVAARETGAAASSIDVVALDVILAEKPATLLSDYRLFADGPAQRPNTGVVPYDLITPLFSDYAEKYRFVFIPPGQSATYHPDEVFEFPVGTVLVKTFAYPADLRRPGESVRLIETRLLVRKAEGWAAYPYVWDEELGDARLKLAGRRLDVTFIDRAGASRAISYRVPNANQCKGCHAIGREIVPIGPKARNLNRTLVYPEGAENQIAAWVKRGLLTGAPAENSWPAVADWRDAAAPLEERARAYLDVNCAHCHRRDGPASNSGLFLGVGEQEPVAWGYRKRPVAAGRGSGGLEFDIDPGNPDRSILIYRMKSLDPGVMMPELGRALVHDEAVRLLEDWVRGLN